MDKNNFLNEINFEYFEYPPSKFNCWIAANKFWLSKIPIYLTKPSLLLANKVNEYDKLLASYTLQGKFLILKDECIQAIYNNSLSAAKTKDILRCVELLKNNNYSVLIFPEKNYSVFGNTAKISTQATNFIFECGMDITMLSLINTHFAKPVWAKTIRKCETKCVSQTMIEHDKLKTLSENEQNELINHCMTASASTHARKNKLFIRSDKRAEYLERIVYLCPKCKELFSIYSEYNCLKCRNCGSFIEISHNGQIEFSKDIYSMDYMDEFLFETLQNKDLKPYQKLISYDNILMLDSQTNKWITLENFEINFGELVIKKNSKNTKYLISAINDIEILPNNTVTIYLKNKTLTFKGENKENFYILQHLRQILMTI